MSAHRGTRTAPLTLPLTDELRAFERVLRFLKASKHARSGLSWEDAVRALRGQLAVLRHERDRCCKARLASRAVESSPRPAERSEVDARNKRARPAGDPTRVCATGRLPR